MRASTILPSEITKIHNTISAIPILLSSNLYPRWLWFEVTDKCNSRCRTCNIWRKEWTRDPLKPEELRRILSSSLFHNVRYVLNSGGEPALVDLYSFLLAEHNAMPNANLQISTNGILAEKVVDTAEKCLAIGIHLDIGISLDGVGAVHDTWRGVKGNFEHVDWLLHKLLDLKKSYSFLNVAVGSTLTNETAKQADKMINYCRKLGVPFMWHWYNVSSFYDNFNADASFDKTALSCALDKVFSSNDAYSQSWHEYLLTGKIQPPFECFALSTFLVLKCNGDIVPCLSKWDDAIGNVRHIEPLNVWCSDEAEQVRCKIKSCEGCLNSWGYGWSKLSQRPFYSILLERAKLRAEKYAHKL